MDELNIKQNIAKNIAALRTRDRLTQAELAEKLNYSDKAVSKWERGDSIPDVLVLYELAELFSVTVDYFLHEHTEDERKPKLEASKNRLRLVITLTSCLSTYFIATLVYFILLTLKPDAGGLWRVFVVPLPVVSILSIVFSSIWVRGKLSLFISVSALIWSITLVAFVFTLGTIKAWFLFVIAVPLQVIVFFWMSLLYKGVARRGSPRTKSSDKAA